MGVFNLALNKLLFSEVDLHLEMCASSVLKIWVLGGRFVGLAHRKGLRLTRMHLTRGHYNNTLETFSWRTPKYTSFAWWIPKHVEYLGGLLGECRPRVWVIAYIGRYSSLIAIARFGKGWVGRIV